MARKLLYSEDFLAIVRQESAGQLQVPESLTFTPTSLSLDQKSTNTVQNKAQSQKQHYTISFNSKAIILVCS